jgi:O-succinylbenzoate synthase
VPGDVSASRRYWKEDIIEPEVEVSRKGFISVSDDAGSGYRVRQELVEQLTVRKETLSSSRNEVAVR